MNQGTTKPKISIIVPICERPDKDIVLKRCLRSIKKQSFTDYEIVMPENGLGWSANHNEGIRRAKGELIKFLHMDDFFSHEHALRDIEHTMRKKAPVARGKIAFAAFLPFFKEEIIVLAR